jgi:hypothetical protein
VVLESLGAAAPYVVPAAVTVPLAPVAPVSVDELEAPVAPVPVLSPVELPSPVAEVRAGSVAANAVGSG